MLRIVHVMAVPVIGGYWVEDLTALQSHPIAVPDRYTAQPTTPGFDAVRQTAEGVSVGLVLDDGRVAWGDCVGVAYGAKSGRDPVFRSRDGLSTIQRTVAPFLQGRELTGFRALAAEIGALTEPAAVTRKKRVTEGELSRRDLFKLPSLMWQSAIDENKTGTVLDVEEKVQVERPLHTAVRYGISQALLQAIALARNLTMTEVIADEWNLPRPTAPVPIHAQSGGERYHNADKMIVRRVASLPHALVDNIPEQMGQDAELLLQ